MLGENTKSPVSLATIFVLKDKSSILTLPEPELTNFKSASDTFVLIVLFSNVKILTFAFCVCTSFHLAVEVPKSPAPARYDDPAVKPSHVLNGILLESGGFSSDHKLSIDGNVISTDEQDGTFQLKSNGTGKTVIGDLQFQESNLFNNSNSNFIFNLTNTSGNAYLKFDNVNGMIPPLGDTSQRPTSPEIGNTRYNTQLERVETWNGTNWINAAGEVESILVGDVEELAYLYNLILD